MSYDLDDRLTFEQEPFGVSITYAYDGMGDVTLQQDSFGGVITSTYDTDQDLWARQFSQGGSVPEQLGFFIYYNGDGTRTLINRYSDAALTNLINQEGFSYDAARRLTGEGAYAYPGGALMFQDTIAYQSDGGAYDGDTQVTSRTNYGESTTTYMYDATGQLTGSQDSVYGNLTYSYDAAGNSAASGTTIGADNQIQTDGVWNYYYDAVGNRTKKINVADSDAWTYAYDDANRLITVKHFTSSSGGVPTGTLLLQENFTYDVFGNRLSDTLTKSSTTVTRFAYDQNGNAWADLDASNQLVTRRLYLNGVDQLFARIDAATGDAFYYMTDEQGSVRAILDVSTNSIVDRLAYDAWGNLLDETDLSYADRYKYTGREWDAALDMQYSRARWYDPNTRTFISPDPAQADPLGNTYRYTENDPADGTDPDGTHLVASNDAAGDNVLNFLSKNGIKAVEFLLTNSGWFSTSTSWDVYVPASERDKLEALGNSYGDWGRWFASSIIGPKNATIGSDLTMTEANFSHAETGGILKAQANYRGFDLDTSTPSLSSQVGQIANAAAEGYSDGALIVTDRLTAGMIDGLHSEAERLIKENGGLYEYSALAGDLARESLVAAATAGAAGVGGRLAAKAGTGAAKLLLTSAQIESLACKGGTVATVAIGFMQAASTAELANKVTDNSLKAWEAYQNGDTYGTVKALSGTVVDGIGLVSSVKDLANTLGSIAKNGLSWACFAVGTPLMTPEGSKPIEQFRVGDRLFSREENQPAGPVEVQVVQEVFVRQSLILELEINGRTIRTTSEHPFWIVGKGWIEAGSAQVGDHVLSHDGQQLVIDRRSQTGQLETVYNLRVANYHTYFVRDEEWGVLGMGA